MTIDLYRRIARKTERLRTAILVCIPIVTLCWVVLRICLLDSAAAIREGSQLLDKLVLSTLLLLYWLHIIGKCERSIAVDAEPPDDSERQRRGRRVVRRWTTVALLNLLFIVSLVGPWVPLLLSPSSRAATLSTPSTHESIPQADLAVCPSEWQDVLMSIQRALSKWKGGYAILRDGLLTDGDFDGDLALWGVSFGDGANGSCWTSIQTPASATHDYVQILYVRAADWPSVKTESAPPLPDPEDLRSLSIDRLISGVTNAPFATPYSTESGAIVVVFFSGSSINTDLTRAFLSALPQAGGPRLRGQPLTIDNQCGEVGARVE